MFNVADAGMNTYYHLTSYWSVIVNVVLSCPTPINPNLGVLPLDPIAHVLVSPSISL